MRLCIIGGGLAGLSLAYFLSNLSRGYEVLVLESNEVIGGLLRSEVVDNYLFDCGGSHVIFSRDRGVLEVMLNLLGSNYVGRRRNSRIFYKGRFIKYPFENGVNDLPPVERYECVRSLIDTYVLRALNKLKPPENFMEWCYYVFGEAISNKYLIPYNEKLWKLDLREISLDWVNDRVPNPPLDDVIKSAVGIETEGYQHQLQFYYPRVGGIESLVRGIANSLKDRGNVLIKVNARVSRIKFEDGGVIVYYGGKELPCDLVVYTGPLIELGNIASDLSREYAEMLKQLRYRSLVVVGIGYRGVVAPYHWIYFPQKDIVFHRVAFLSNYSELVAPENSASIIAEITCSDDGGVCSEGDKSIIQAVVDDLSRVGLINSSNVEVAKVWRWRYGYVIYDFKRSPILRCVSEYLRGRGVILHGRFGGWEYLNMDHVIERSMKLAETISSMYRSRTLG